MYTVYMCCLLMFFCLSLLHISGGLCWVPIRKVGMHVYEALHFSFSPFPPWKDRGSTESTAPNHFGFWTGCLITRIENGWEGKVQGGPGGGWLHIVKVLRLWTHHFPYSCRLHCRNLSTRLRFLVGGHPPKICNFPMSELYKWGALFWSNLETSPAQTAKR